jgi:hypothetical protein
MEQRASFCLKRRRAERLKRRIRGPHYRIRPRIKKIEDEDDDDDGEALDKPQPTVWTNRPTAC